jgi:DNA-directed RNA polymerase subunit omega
MPPSTRDIIEISNSKYAVVVGIAKRARSLSEKSDTEEYRLANMINETINELIEGNLKINNNIAVVTGDEKNA